jgi:hypothetical protein
VIVQACCRNGGSGAEDNMAGRIADQAEASSADRLRDLARRCRELSDMTAVPDMVRELVSIARALENEAALNEQ